MCHLSRGQDTCRAIIDDGVEFFWEIGPMKQSEPERQGLRPERLGRREADSTLLHEDVQLSSWF